MATTEPDGPRLLSLAVHEFRTPVTVVAGYIRMLLKMSGAGLGDQPRKLLEEAEKSCARLAALLGELSDLSNTQAGHVAFAREDLDLFALAAEVASRVHEGEDRDVRLDVRPAERPAVVRGDRARLGQAIASLMTAMLRERAEPGVIAIEGGIVADDDHPQAYLVMAPRDRGAAPGFRPQDWLPFDRWRGGVGFRLLLACEVVAAHGGTLFSGRDQLARGACVLALPLKERSC